MENEWKLARQFLPQFDNVSKGTEGGRWASYG